LVSIVSRLRSSRATHSAGILSGFPRHDFQGTLLTAEAK
jgi:hypothetical protein